MRRVDLNENPRIRELADVLRQASTIHEPQELLKAFGKWISERSPRDFMVSVSRRGLGPGEYKITRVLPGSPGTREYDDYIRKSLANPWRDWATMPTHTGGFLGEVIADDEPKLYRDLDLTTDEILAPVLGEHAKKLRWASAMPSYDEGDAINWSISFSAQEQWLSLGDYENGLLDLNMLGTATRNLVTLKRVKELAAAQRRQFEQIASIQRALLPERVPKIPGLEIATSYLTSDDAGGDYYDFFPFPNGTWGILIADVAGHGASAATVMAMLHSILHCYNGQSFSPADVMDFANQKLLSTSGQVGSFVTAFLAAYEPKTATFRYTRAGHNPPRIKRSVDGKIIELDGASAPPLGVFDEFEPVEETVTLGRHDTLVLYTDGITEAFNEARTMFGTEGLDRALEQCSGEPDCVIGSVHNALYEHTRVRTRDDDQTLVALRYVGEGAGDGDAP